MSIERRYGPRDPVALMVQVSYRKRHFSRALAHNLSIEGIYLQVPNLTLPEGTMVELELEAGGKDWLLPGIVIYSQDAGIGIMIREPHPALFRAVPRAQTQARPPRSQSPQRQPLVNR